MTEHSMMNRRRFLGRIAVTAAAVSFGAARAAEKPKTEVSIFSKHLQWLDLDAMARTAAEIGFDGVDLTVRPGGHIEPAKAVDELPRAAEAARKAGIKIAMMTTAITDPEDRYTEGILKTASSLGIGHYRAGYYRYDKNKSIEATLADANVKLRGLAAMNKHFNIHGGYQNHTGDAYVGASIWDIWYALRGVDTKWMGSQFDIRHATVEGSNSWPTDVRLMAPMIDTIVAKDFVWAKKDGKWTSENCPLGEGAVDFPKYMRQLKQLSVHVPATLHFEYPIGGAEHGARKISIPKEQVTDVMRRDLGILRGLLAKAGL